jgi:hypothetical protein
VKFGVPLLIGGNFATGRSEVAFEDQSEMENPLAPGGNGSQSGPFTLETDQSGAATWRLTGGFTDRNNDQVADSYAEEQVRKEKLAKATFDKVDGNQNHTRINYENKRPDI